MPNPTDTIASLRALLLLATVLILRVVGWSIAAPSFAVCWMAGALIDASEALARLADTRKEADRD